MGCLENGARFKPANPVQFLDTIVSFLNDDKLFSLSISLMFIFIFGTKFDIRLQ